MIFPAWVRDVITIPVPTRYAHILSWSSGSKHSPSANFGSTPPASNVYNQPEMISGDVVKAFIPGPKVVPAVANDTDTYPERNDRTAVQTMQAAGSASLSNLSTRGEPVVRDLVLGRAIAPTTADDNVVRRSTRPRKQTNLGKKFVPVSSPCSSFTCSDMFTGFSKRLRL